MDGKPIRFEYAVIGKGLIGSAAARHLCDRSDSVVIIGPDEPRGDLSRADVFASHYDQGRITRIVGKSALHMQLNAAAIRNYPALQETSGVRFHGDEGCLYVSPNAENAYLQNGAPAGVKYGVRNAEYGSSSEISAAHPEYDFPSGVRGLFEEKPAGHINPRRLVLAQLSVFEQRGGNIVREIAMRNGFSGDSMRVITGDGQVIFADKVLVAAGSFSNFHGLLPRKLDLLLQSETIILGEVSAAEAAQMSPQPSLIYDVARPGLNSIYLVHALRYGDGRYYVKMGCNLDSDRVFGDLQEIRDWFAFGDSESQEGLMRDALTDIMPATDFLSFQTRRCIIARTPHLMPYIGPVVDGRVYVAAGGNGFAAKCSDELGRLAACVVSEDTFPAEYDARAFRPLYAKEGAA